MTIESQVPACTIDSDIPCTQCGYNLRGLEPAGRCPECGQGIAVTFETRQRLGVRLLGRADPRWLQELLEGMVLFNLVIVLQLSLGFAPEGAFYPYKPGRAVGLGVICAAWVLQAAGIWKLTRPRAGKVATFWDEFWRWALRIAGAVYFAAPFIWTLGMRSYGGSETAAPIMMICLLAGFVAIVAFYQHLRQISMRLPSMSLSILSLLLCAGHAWIWWTLDLHGAPEPSSIELMVEIPTLVLIAPVISFELIRMVRDATWTVSGSPEALTLVSCWAATLILIPWLTLRLIIEWRRSKRESNN